MSLKHDSQIVTQKNCINGYRKICINGYRISCGSRRRMKDDYGLWAWEGMSGHPTLQTPQWVQKFWRYFNKETYWFLIDDMPCDSDYIWDGHPRYRGPNNAGRTGIWYGYLYFCYYFADFCPFVLVEKSKGRSVKDKRLRLKVNVSIFNLNHWKQLHGAIGQTITPDLITYHVWPVTMNWFAFQPSLCHKNWLKWLVLLVTSYQIYFFYLGQVWYIVIDFVM